MKKILTLGIATLAVAGIVGASSVGVSALNGQGNGVNTGTHQGDGLGGGRQSSLESRAAVLNMTAAELEKALETKTMSQLALDKGLSEADFQAKMQTAAKARWEARGLSADEVAERVAEQQKRHETNSADHEFGSGDGAHEGGYGRNR